MMANGLSKMRERISPGRMPPLLYAVGVLNVEINPVGIVTRLDWMRAPRHAPEVIAEIERMIQKASPFPAPTRIGKVIYTDTWLWHKSGKFQLDTLTEGQNEGPHGYALRVPPCPPRGPLRLRSGKASPAAPA